MNDAPGEWPRVSILVLNHNGGPLLERCIHSLLKTEYSSFEVVLVDNNSSDGSVEKAVELNPKLVVVRNPTNLGYSSAYNKAARICAGTFLVFLNNDTEVDPPWLGGLVEFALQHHASILQPKILFLRDRRTVNSAGNDIHVAGFGLCRGLGDPDTAQYSTSREIGYASGACLFVAKNVFEKLGGFDENLMTYNEDTDFGWRARILGISSYYVPDSVIYHAGSATFTDIKTKLGFLDRSRLMMLLKNYSALTLARISPFLILVELAVIAHSILYGWFRLKIRSYSDVLRSLRLVRAARESIQSARSVPDQLVMRTFTLNMKHIMLANWQASANALSRTVGALSSLQLKAASV